jgi:mRNA-degrading endonuclease toxin of MazEF toxin-antitoxin module
VSQTLTIDRSLLDGCIGTLSAAELHEVDDGLRLALGL